MTEPMLAKAIKLTIPAEGEYALVARMALSGLALLAGLDVDLIGDLRTVTDECCDCLMHQPLRPACITVDAWIGGGRLFFRFGAEKRCGAGCEQTLQMDITKGVLETLMPEVRLDTDEDGVFGIECSMPV